MQLSSLQIWSVLSPVLIVAGALVLIALERRFPYDRRQKLFRAGFWDDLIGYTFIQSYLLGLLITQVSTWIDGATGLSRLHLVSAWPIWVQVAFFIITHDLYIYTFHRLQHRFAPLWRIHEAHHATVDVDWLSGSRSHALEIMVNQSIEFVPILLLGAAPEVWLIKITIDALWGMYIHCNVDVRSGWLQKIINGPEMHRWHHAIEIRDGVNFAHQVRVLGLDSRHRVPAGAEADRLRHRRAVPVRLPRAADPRVQAAGGRRPRGTTRRSTAARTDSRPTAIAAAGSAPCRMSPKSFRRMPVRIG